MAEIASAFVSVAPSAKGFGSKLDSEIGGDIKSSGSRSGKIFGTALKVGALAALGGAAIVGKFLGDSLDEAREAQKVGALTESTIKATGGAAKVTAKQVEELAGAISRKTGIDDETIQSGENMLLTFKNIRNEAGKGNDIFDQATETLIDMSSAMGTEPRQAAIQLGKALNDPVKGISALSRVGVTFSDGQKTLIDRLVETGDKAGAQKVILHELRSEFGGAAEAQATAGDKMKVAWDNLKETAGNAILPIVDRILPKLTDGINGIADDIRNHDWSALWSKFKNATSTAFTTSQRLTREFFVDKLIPAINSGLSKARKAWAAKWDNFWRDPQKAYNRTIHNTDLFGDGLTGAAGNSAKNAAFAFIKAFNGIPRAAGRIGTQTLGSWRQSMAGMPKLATAVAVDVEGSFFKGVASMPGRAHDLAISVGLALIGGFRNMISGAGAIGVAIVGGLIGGIRDSAGAVATEAARVVTNAIQAAKDAAHIKSPSRKTRELGRYMGEGLALGIEDSHARVNSAMDRLTGGAMVRSPGLSSMVGVGGRRGGAAVFHLYDNDGVLMGSIDGRIQAHEDLRGQTARAM